MPEYPYSSALGFTLGDANEGILDTYAYHLSIKVGVTYCPEDFFFDETELILNLGRPAIFLASMRDRSATPAVGDVLTVYNDGGVGYGNQRKLFNGTITRAECLIQNGPTSHEPVWRITATDTTASMAQLVWGWWRTKGINTIVRDVVSDLVTAGTLSVGYLPASLGTLDSYQVSGKTIPAVLDDLAAAAGASWTVDADGRLHMFTSPDHLAANTLAITNTSANVRDLHTSTDTSDAATQVRVRGMETTLREAVTPSSLTLPIASWEPFNYTSGTVVVGGVDLCTYTAGTTISGSETLTLDGGSRVTRDWPAGTTIAPVVTSGSTATSQRYVEADSTNAYGAATLGASLVTLYASGISEVSGTTVDVRHTGAKYLVPGTTVSLDLTAPITISGTYRVQSVTLRPRRINGEDRWERTFVAGPVSRYNDTFNQVMGY